MARTACILCSRNCGLDVEVAEGRLTAVRGDPEHPLSAGYLCQKAARLDYYQNNEDRLEYPLRRTGDGSFERVSWEQALDEIAAKLRALRSAHGGKCFAFYGGGGQGNHLGAAYSTGLLFAMRSPYRYNALAQEKTGDFWVNGKIFGRQDCHVSEDVERADLVLFIGTNPWQAHGVRNARQTVQELARDPQRGMVVIDPRRTETAKLADVHLQLRPGTDAFLLAALLAILVREGLIDQAFIRAHTRGFDELATVLAQVPIDAYLARADVPRADVERVARMLARARAACVRVDLGLQQSLHSTLNSYLEKLLFLLTGNFAKPGGNNLHTFFLPIFIHSYDRLNPRTVVARMPAIGGIYPPNVLPGEIDSDHPKRVRALFVDSANPMISGADSAAYERALRKLELLVVVDVAMTETARHAHYVLPAASQFEKWEATGFNLDFPRNYFHLRAPLFAPRGETLPEPEIYTRLLRKLGALPAKGFPRLAKLAQRDRQHPGLGLFWLGLAANMLLHPSLALVGSNVLQQTIGRTFLDGADAAAPLWFLSHVYALRYRQAVRRAGFHGRGLMLGEDLFRAILEKRSGTLLSEHTYEETWSLVGHRDRKLRLAIPELLRALAALEQEPAASDALPYMLIAGERRSYNANTIYRDPRWRKNDRDGALAIHPSDAASLGLRERDRALVRSAVGELRVTVHLSDVLRPGVVSLPHGYGMRYADGEEDGPALNRLTSASHCDPIAATPFHKNVPVSITALHDDAH